MKVTILCTDRRHPVVRHLVSWRERKLAEGQDVTLVHDRRDLPGGDILFLVSCSQLIGPQDRAKYRSVLVLHASDLPRGRGWSPHIWAILNGESRITVCLLEADEPVDSGAVWLRRSFELDGSELLPEINSKLFRVELELMDEAVERFGEIIPRAQEGEPGPYLRKRTPADSRIDPHMTIAEQFDLLRVADQERHPAFMEFRGHRYVINVQKVTCT